MNEILLRPYQQQFIIDVYNEFNQGHKRVVGVAPCGAGKTIIAGWMIRQATLEGKRSIFFVHRHELIRQTSETFERLGIKHGIISAGYDMQLDLPVQIASVQTLARRLKKVPAPDFLICDECHHILANTYMRIVDAYPDAYLLGVTATPQRMGGVTLHDVFTSMVQGSTVDELISLGNLTDFHYFAPETDIDLRRVHIKFGEYVNSELARVMADKRIIGSIVENYIEHAAGKSAICYCVNVKHSKKVAEAFCNAGIIAEHVDGETPAALREDIVGRFRAGETKILCNAELFSEGFDVPNMQAVILARPTKSLTLFIQQALRPMRPDPSDPNKVAIIIDHVKNYTRHGLPNMVHDWTLDPNKPKKTSGAPLKVCPECELVVPLGVEICPKCGYEFVTEEEKESRLEEYSGVLRQINKEVNIIADIQRIIHASEDIIEMDDDDNVGSMDPIIYTPSAKSKDFVDKNAANIQRTVYIPTKPEEFMEIAKARNYKVGWVAYKSLEYATSYEDCLHIAEVCGYKKGWAYYRWEDIQQERA